jgi:hypothetical protein
MLRHARYLSLAFALSTVGLVVALALHAMLLFRSPVVRQLNVDATDVRSLSICDDGCAALLLIREPGVLYKDSFRFSLAPFSTIDSPTPLRLPMAGLVPWRATGASRGPYGFIATTAGDLYSLDLAARSAPVRLGQHQEKYPFFLGCTADGALLVASGFDGISCWDRAAARCLWRHSDIGLYNGTFVPGTKRFFATLETGPILELDASSGITLRELTNHCGPFIQLDISADGQRLAATNTHGVCVVSELATGKPLWSRPTRIPEGTPRFSPDGSILMVPDQRGRPRVSLFSTASGDLLGELIGAQAAIVGLAVTPQGAVYAWDLSGTVSVWNLGSRRLRFQFQPGKST